MMRYAVTGIPLFLILSFAVGCEQKTVVSGNVTYNGQPVEEGNIIFRPAGGAGQSFGTPIKNGIFSADKAQPGAYTAVIVGVKKLQFAMSSEEAARKAKENKAKLGHLAGQVAEAADYIPEDAEGNSKTVEITAGSQTIDFDVKGPPRT